MRAPSIAVALGLCLLASEAAAAVVWTGDIETGDLSQFNYVLNENIGGNIYAAASQKMVLEGDWAARIELHDDAIWPNGLRRVELQHLPDPARTAEGATTCFGWSLYLPEALPDDPGHTLGYWESQNSYQQMMAFNTNGPNIRFITQQPMYVEHWSADGVLTPNEWHRIAMCVLWSEDPSVGLVHVWFDGEQVVTAAPAKTLADTNPHFAQIGLLRADVDLGAVPVIFIDDVVEGDTIEDVDPPTPPGGTGTGGSDGGGDTTTGASGAGSSDGSPPPDSDSGQGVGTTGGGIGTGGGSDTGAAMARDDSSDGGCGCRTDPRRTAGWSVLALLGLMLGRRRRDG